MMEVAGVMNRLFAREPASRRRNLYLRRCSLSLSSWRPSLHPSAALSPRTACWPQAIN